MRLGDLLIGLIDAGLLCDELGVEIGDAGLRLLDLGFCLIDLGLVIAAVEPDQGRAGLDQLIVGHRNVDDGGADLCADLHGAGIDEGIVGRLVVPGAEPPHHKAGNRDHDQRRQRQRQDAMLTKGFAPRTAAPRPAVGEIRFAVGRRFGATLAVDALIHMRLNV